MTRRFTFRASQRLHRRRDFDAVFAKRCSAGDDLLVVYVAGNDLDHCRLGIRVGRQYGPAVARSRFRRLVREAFRLQQHDVPPGVDIVCLARRGRADQVDAAMIARSLKDLLRRALARLARMPDRAE